MFGERVLRTSFEKGRGNASREFCFLSFHLAFVYFSVVYGIYGVCLSSLAEGLWLLRGWRRRGEDILSFLRLVLFVARFLFNI